MRTGDPLIVNLACTGAMPSRAQSPYVPLTHDEIVHDVARCIELGVQMVHLHARDADGQQTSDPDAYGRLVESIRRLPGGKDVVIGVTTTGRVDNSFEARSRVLDLDGLAKPDTASLTLSSLNFMQSASINSPDTIRRLAARMQERGIRPELEVFDLGMANFINVLVKEGLIDGSPYVNVLLGNIAGAQANLMQLAALLAQLPQNAVVAVAGLGRVQMAANTLGLLVADGVRVGLEDNLWLDHKRTQSACNARLVRRAVEMGLALERELMAPAEVRQRLGLANG